MFGRKCASWAVLVAGVVGVGVVVVVGVVVGVSGFDPGEEEIDALIAETGDVGDDGAVAHDVEVDVLLLLLLLLLLLSLLALSLLLLLLLLLLLAAAVVVAVTLSMVLDELGAICCDCDLD